MKFIRSFAVLVLLSAFGCAALAADTLTPLVERLKADPTNAALRQEIIQTAVSQKNPPQTPEEARRFFVQANSALTDAKTPADFDHVIELYRNASNQAPWWADVYSGLAKVLEQREQYDAAMTELKLYLLAAPKAPDAREAQDKIYVLEEKLARVNKATADQAAAAKAAAELSAQRKLWARAIVDELNTMFRGKKIRKTWVCTLDSNNFTGCTDSERKSSNWWNFNPVYPCGVKFEVSPDGEKVQFFEGYDNGPKYGSGYFPPKTGTPTSYSRDFMKWVDDQGKTKTIIFWTASSNGLPYYQISDSPYYPDEAGFNPNERYHYTKGEGS